VIHAHTCDTVRSHARCWKRVHDDIVHQKACFAIEDVDREDVLRFIAFRNDLFYRRVRRPVGEGLTDLTDPAFYEKVTGWANQEAGILLIWTFKVDTADEQ
jgi:hypothetical protein